MKPQRGDVITSGNGRIVSKVLRVLKDGRLQIEDLYLGKQFARHLTVYPSSSRWRHATRADHVSAQRYARRWTE